MGTPNGNRAVVMEDLAYSHLTLLHMVTSRKSASPSHRGPADGSVEKERRLNSPSGPCGVMKTVQEKPRA